MPNEAAKAKPRLLSLLVGRGLDIGCGTTPILESCDRWDWEQGDAQYVPGCPLDHYDWIFSSHLLEHVKDPTSAVARWWKSLKPGGFLIVLVPDEDLYEKGHWPSRYNFDHKHTFTCSKQESWSPVSINVVDMLQALPGHKLISLTVQDTDYDYWDDNQDHDQTAGGAEASIQLIVWKQPVALKPQLIENVVYNYA